MQAMPSFPFLFPPFDFVFFFFFLPGLFHLGQYAGSLDIHTRVLGHAAAEDIEILANCQLERG